MILPRLSILVLMSVTPAALLLVIEGRRLVHAHQEYASTGSALGQTVLQAQEIINLRAMHQTVEVRQRPAQDVIAQVNAVLAEIGIPSQQLRSLTPESEGAAVASVGGAGGADGGRLLQQSLRLVLEKLTPTQIGAFLIQWRTAQQIWTPTRIELTHSRVSDQSTERDGNSYDATILLAALYVANTAAPPSAASSPPTVVAQIALEQWP